ncbi:unnamed protein product [Ectocarpus sp. 12 AP-2014]
MGYFNPFQAYGLNKLVHDAHRKGVDGFLVVDRLPDDAHDFISKCHKYHLLFISLVTPTTTNYRIPFIASAAESFVYCVNQAPKKLFPHQLCSVPCCWSGPALRSVEQNAAANPHTTRNGRGLPEQPRGAETSSSWQCGTIGRRCARDA